MRSSTNTDKSLYEALHFIKIDMQRFQRIPTLALKREYLDYRFTRLEFMLIRDYPNDKQQLDQADRAYALIMDSPLFTEHDEVFSVHSVGLQRLMTHRLLATHNVMESSKEPSLEQSSLEESIIVRGKKNAGVEPGFIAVMAKDHYLHIRHLFPDKESRRTMMRMVEGNVALIEQVLKDTMPTYMFKLAYQNITDGGKVSPNQADLERSNTMKQLKATMPGLLYQLASSVYSSAKTKQFDELNIEAIQEVLANDIARVYGMTVQEQALFPAEYNTGRMQLLLIGKWLQNSRELGGEHGSALAGGGDDSNYLVKPLLNPQHNLVARSDTSIKKLSEMLCAMIVLSDRDGVGKQAQNKLVVENEMVGIDFGKAFQSNELIKNVANDFSLPEKLMQTFRNYTIFYDAPRSEFVRGLIRMACIAGDVHFLPGVLFSYGEAFRSEMTGIQKYADEMIFDDYIRIFQTLIDVEFASNDAVSLSNRECCVKIINKIDEVKEIVGNTRNALLNKFKCYFVAEKHVVDLLENIEKMIAAHGGNTSMRSRDNRVLLAHLRMKTNPVNAWDITRTDIGNYVIEATFTKASAANNACKLLRGWVDKSLAQCVSSNMNMLTLKLNKEQALKFSALLDEAKIKSKYHPDDYHMELVLRLEDQIIQSITGWSMYGVDSELTYVNNQPQLKLKRRQDAEVDVKFFQFLRMNFPLLVDQGGIITLKLGLPHIENLAAIVHEISNHLERENKNTTLLGTYQGMCNQSHERWFLPQGLIMKLNYHAVESGQHGYFTFQTVTSDKVLADIIGKCKFLHDKHSYDDLPQLDDIMKAVGVQYHRECEALRLQEMERQELREQAHQRLLQQEREQQRLQDQMRYAQVLSINENTVALRAELISYVDHLGDSFSRTIKNTIKSSVNYLKPDLFAVNPVEAGAIGKRLSDLIQLTMTDNRHLIANIDDIHDAINSRQTHILKMNDSGSYDPELAILKKLQASIRVILELRNVCGEYLQQHTRFDKNF